MPLMTTISDIDIEDVLNSFSYLMARQGLDDSALYDTLEMMLEDYGGWEIAPLVAQIKERAEVIANAL